MAIGAVHFASSSATPGKAVKKKPTHLARVITAQGFTRGCLVGHPDSIASVAHNKALSKHRVKNVAV